MPYTIDTVHRHFESLKRSSKEQSAQGSGLEKVMFIREKRKKNARAHRVRSVIALIIYIACTRLQLYERRQAAVKPSEQAIWKKITVEFMTDEIKQWRR